jgi:hypothetical protein
VTPFHDPYGIFRGSRTPPGLYARQKWLGEADTAKWRSDYAETVLALNRGRSPDGLWQKSPLVTIHRLFGLHLTVRKSDPMIDQTLSRLMAAASSISPGPKHRPAMPEDLIGLPFAPGDWAMVVPPAAAFLAAIFGRGSDPKVVELVDRLAVHLMETAIPSENARAVHNLLRAFAVRPDHLFTHAIQAAVAFLGERQTLQGDWGEDIPFYQCLNALAHLKIPASEVQCRKALHRLMDIQNPDGSWGHTQREWSTFLSIHALRNLGVLG